jgi:hypothetical protein
VDHTICSPPSRYLDEIHPFLDCKASSISIWSAFNKSYFRPLSSRIALSVSRHLLEAFDQMASPLPHLPGIPLFLNLFNFIEEHCQLLVVLSQALLLRSDHPCSRGLGL